MNYNISRIEMILEVFALFDIAKVEIKKEHQLLMVGETTSFKKRTKEKKENFKKNDKQVATLMKKPKFGPKTDTECFYCKKDWSLEAELPQIIGG